MRARSGWKTYADERDEDDGRRGVVRDLVDRVRLLFGVHAAVNFGRAQSASA